MALDAVITAVHPHEEGILLNLGARPAQDYLSDGELVADMESIPGQNQMIVVGATWEPHVGDMIWGGSGSVIIESGGISFPYQREGYGRLHQSW